MSGSVQISFDGPVRILRIARPAARNAIDSKTAYALREAWLDFDRDPEARVGILTGGDEVFCAGADLRDLDALAADAADIESPHGPLGFTRLSVSKPTIAAIAGYCVAGGLELACWCDLRIADDTAVFGCFERRFGVPLIDGGTQRLPQIVGLGRALEMILTGRPVTVQEAKAMGLVNEVVPPGQALERAIEIAKALADFPQAALRNDRRAVYEGLGLPIEEGLRVEARCGRETWTAVRRGRGRRRFRTARAGAAASNRPRLPASRIPHRQRRRPQTQEGDPQQVRQQQVDDLEPDRREEQDVHHAGQNLDEDEAASSTGEPADRSGPGWPASTGGAR